MAYTLRNDPQRRDKLLAELNRISSLLAGTGVDKVILFGSMARDDVGTSSDIDLIIIQRTEKRFLDRIGDMYSLLQPSVAMDILVYTPDELRQLREESSFVRRALSEGQVLYEKETC